MSRLRVAAVAVLGPLAAAIAVSASLGAGAYNTTDPRVFAPHCQSVLHRPFKHCLNPSTVGQVELTGVTRAGESSRTPSTGTVIDMLSGAEYEFSVDAPKPCPPVLKKGQETCTVSVDWAPIYGASLAKWGSLVQDTLEVNPYLGCDHNDRECDFEVDYTSGGVGLPEGAALRVTAVANVYGLPCGKTSHGYCEHWMDWRLRLHNQKRAPNLPVQKPSGTPPADPFKGAPPGTVAYVQEISGLAPGKKLSSFVQKGGKGPFKKLDAGGFLQPGDVIRTDANTVMALELALGGRVGINKSSEVEIKDERSVKNTEPAGFQISKGGMWAKCGALKEPIEIQTNGGVMGIKG